MCIARSSVFKANTHEPHNTRIQIDIRASALLYGMNERMNEIQKFPSKPRIMHEKAYTSLVPTPQHLSSIRCISLQMLCMGPLQSRILLLVGWLAYFTLPLHASMCNTHCVYTCVCFLCA